jgi:hypothetical protein
LIFSLPQEIISAFEVLLRPFGIAIFDRSLAAFNIGSSLRD